MTPEQRKLIKQFPRDGYIHRSCIVGATDTKLKNLCLKGLIEEHPEIAWSFRLRKVAA